MIPTSLSKARHGVPWTALIAAIIHFAISSPAPCAAAPDSTVVQSIASGSWSNPKTWEPARIPGVGDDVLITGGTSVIYDAESTAVIRSVRVAGKLTFARKKDTILNVGYLRVQPGATGASDDSGVEDVHKGDKKHGHGGKMPSGMKATAILEVGAHGDPIEAGTTARIRLHYIEGMERDRNPAIVCRPGGRMEFHGAPMSRTWLKLGEDAEKGSQLITLSEEVTGWSAGDEIIITGSERPREFGSFRKGEDGAEFVQTEERRIVKIEDGRRLTLDKPLSKQHAGSGDFRCEVANLSRNVIIESADPDGVRGHTMYHWSSRGSISYARFAHLGKEGVLGRYPIHFHMVEDTMRGSSVIGAAIVDSHNRWVTVHGTQYMVVRDCVGYQSVGHGYYLEDGTEVYNLLDRNLGVQSYDGPGMKNQALPFDPNDGAAFWWANGLNTLTRNVGAESDQYGFRYDMRKSSRFSPELSIRQPDGTTKEIDVRTLPIWRFEDNEAHGNFAGMVVAANGIHQPDSGIRTQGALDRIRNIDWTGPDRQHPHVIRNFTIWQAHYAFRPQSPSMLVEGLRIDRATYGVYRPAFDNHVYQDIHLSRCGPEPFNRGMDDTSAQAGSITVDGLTLEQFGNSSQSHPLVHMTDNNLSGDAECHFARVKIIDCDPRRAVFNRGGSQRVDPILDKGVPYYIHDHFGPGRDAKVVTTRAKNLINDGNEYKEETPLTGDESRIAEVSDVPWPKLLDPKDDLPPATVITSVRTEGDNITIGGVCHDNGKILAVVVNGVRAKLLSSQAGVVDWSITLPRPDMGAITAAASDEAGNVEKTPHVLMLGHPQSLTP